MGVALAVSSLAARLPAERDERSMRRMAWVRPESPAALRLLMAALTGMLPILVGMPTGTGAIEDAGTLDPGSVEFGLSAEYAQRPPGHSGMLTGVASAGLVNRFDVRAEVSSLLRGMKGEGAQMGLGDSLIVFRRRVVDQRESIPALLGALALRLPTGDESRGLGAAGVDVGLLAVASQVFTWPHTAHLLGLVVNGGYTFVTRDRALDFWTVAGSIQYQATRRWVLAGEVIAELRHRARLSASDTVVVRGGAVYKLSERMRLEGALGVGGTRASPDLIATV